MGNLSLRIKGPSAEEVQARSYSCLPAEQERPPPASCLGEIPGDKYPPRCVEGALHPILWRSRGARAG